MDMGRHGFRIRDYMRTILRGNSMSSLNGPLVGQVLTVARMLMLVSPVYWSDVLLQSLGTFVLPYVTDLLGNATAAPSKPQSPKPKTLNDSIHETL